MAKRRELTWLAITTLALVVMTLAIPALAEDPQPAAPVAPNGSDDLGATADQIFKLFAGATTFEHDQQSKGKNPSTPPIMRRPVFSKSQGCLQGTFAVAPELPNEFRIGVLSGPSYDAWMRFSNDGAVGPDTVAMPDGNPARGAAIKLVGVPGPKLLPGQETALTQDFLLENNPAFFSATAKDFLAFNLDFDGFMKTHPSESRILEEIQTAQLADPLAGTYWTPTPVRLGPSRQMKYVLKPCSRKQKWTAMVGDNYLRDNLAAHVASATQAGDLCMDFYIQLYVNDLATPLDNATVAWSEAQAPLIHAARLTFKPGQNINLPARVARCESLSFNLWHSIAEHEPLGSINAVRKIVYQKIAEMRKTYNNANGHPMSAAEPVSVSDKE